MANTATNFGVGLEKVSAFDKQNEIESLSINKLNSIEDLKRSGIDVNVTPQVTMTNR